MKFALLMSSGETVALASRLIGVGAQACTVLPENPLPACDFLIFDESVPLTGAKSRTETRRLCGEALSKGKPILAFLSPVAPVTPKCAVVMNELIGFSSAAVVTPAGASDILGLDEDDGDDEKIAREIGDDAFAIRAARLARALCTAHDLTFALVFDGDEERGVLFTGDAYDVITASSAENAVAELFRSAN